MFLIYNSKGFMAMVVFCSQPNRAKVKLNAF